MNALPLDPGAIAHSAGRIGADGWPPSELLQSSKSSACDAVPLISAALSTSTWSDAPKISAGPAAAVLRSTDATTAVVSSVAPANVTPTVSRMPCFATSTASAGRAS